MEETRDRTRRNNDMLATAYQKSVNAATNYEEWAKLNLPDPDLFGEISPTTDTIEAWFDGACEPINPGGHGSYGAIVKVGGEIVLSEGGYVGHGPAISNNVAEYAGIIAALKCVASCAGSGVIRGDSKMVIMQLSGKWAARKGLYLHKFNEAKYLFDRVRDRIRLEWIPREENELCDALSKGVLLGRNVKFRIQRSPC